MALPASEKTPSEKALSEKAVASSAYAALEAGEYDAYSSTLLDDHPLRSYPCGCDGCPPVLRSYWGWRGSCCAGGEGKRWSERLFLVLLQFLSILPYAVSYVFLRGHPGGLLSTGSLHWPAELARQSSACIAYDPSPRADQDVVDKAIATGCTGVKADVRLDGQNLIVGQASSGHNRGDTLRGVYLQPLLERLNAKKKDSDAMIGVFDHDPARSFTLFLELQSPVRDAWPYLVAQLADLRANGYLTESNGSRVVVPAPVTVVVTGVDAASINEMTVDYHPDTEEGESLFPPYIFFETRLAQVSPAANHEAGEKDEEESPIQQQRLHSATSNFQRDILGHSHCSRRFSLTQTQIDRVRSQVEAAHRRGLPVRVTHLPGGSKRQRRRIWRLLVREGVDLVDVDVDHSTGDRRPSHRIPPVYPVAVDLIFVVLRLLPLRVGGNVDRDTVGTDLCVISNGPGRAGSRPSGGEPWFCWKEKGTTGKWATEGKGSFEGIFSGSTGIDSTMANW
ncbi:hypothetical protein BDW42DRAFT_194023 [Aspergillus taichungensis]|uniref:PLC-like phosphodiesterase n=1 Tax=Aspergillus taichungensis TaxID=482145 RepID=A0A2J5HUM7_9EURO|nr:hypothetical protein BDW42DRAFT_194023 [Aspergillus taichungensis]